MRWRNIVSKASAIGVILVLPCMAEAPPDSSSAEVERVMQALYASVSTVNGVTPDWEKVKAMFIPEAVIVLRTKIDSTSVFTVDEFIADFRKFNDDYRIKESGFTEKVVRMKNLVFGEAASVSVLYEAAITSLPRPPQQGVDLLLLTRRGGRWLIAGIVNEIVLPFRPVPEELRSVE